MLDRASKVAHIATWTSAFTIPPAHAGLVFHPKHLSLAHEMHCEPDMVFGNLIAGSNHALQVTARRRFKFTLARRRKVNRIHRRT